MVDRRNLGTRAVADSTQAYDAGSHDDDYFPQATQIAKVIGIHNAMVVKGNVRAVRGPGATGNQDLVACDSEPSAIAALNFQCVRVQK